MTYLWDRVTPEISTPRETAIQFGEEQQPEPVELLGMGRITTEPSGHVGDLLIVGAAPMTRVFDRDRGRIDLQVGISGGPWRARHHAFPRTRLAATERGD